MKVLSEANLSGIRSVPTPTYDRSTAQVGIVHFGFGNFHRSHQAMYIDRLLETGSHGDWAICGVGILPQDSAMRDVMRQQDGLYTLVVRHPDGSLEPHVIGSAIEYLFGPDDPEAVYARLIDPRVRIVSLTVTEGGYLKNAATGEFDAANPAVIHDLAHLENPQTAFAYIVEALRRRRDSGIEPFTVLSCDNLQGNGDIARTTITSFARLIEPRLETWIRENVSFPNCMVDRITPGTTDADRAAVTDEFGYSDEWPVPAEPFTQWIVEDDFPAGRPLLELVGVQFVDDVKPYELMKLRLLNASHQAIAYLGAPLGYTLVDESLRDEDLRTFLELYMAKEAAPTLGDLPGINVEEYIRTLIERFSNPRMKDTLKRLATDGSNRMATFTLPAVQDNLDRKRSIRLGAFMVAAWQNYWVLIGTGNLPLSEVPDDAHAAEMTRAALAREHNPRAFIELFDLFGRLSGDETFTAEFLRASDLIAREGMRQALAQTLAMAGEN